MSTPESSPNGEEPDFEPAINAAELFAHQDQEDAERRAKMEADSQAREAHRQELLDRGYTTAEAGSVINSGYVMREVHEAEQPSQAYLDDVARQEAAKNQPSEAEDLPKAA